MNAIYDPDDTNIPVAPVKKTPASLQKKSDAGNIRTKAAPIFVEAEKMLDKMADITMETAAKAFDFFRERGGEWGKELEDWFNAERDVLRPVPIEIRETDKTIYVTAAVPGFKADEIEISVKDNFLILSGNAEARNSKNDGNVVVSEWNSNRFFRQLYLPTIITADKVEARLADGMLELTLPKAAVQEATKIAVAAG
ncbi:MAG: Hsp20/alpha crystallin family protein [Acidobacteriota bacterium]